MKRVSEKLNHRGGASLVIALVMVLVAVFVGGSVLAAATVNGGRLANRRLREQSYLSQRSAAAILSDELNQSVLSLSILPGVEDGQKTLTVSAGGNQADRNAVTELFYEVVAAKYLSLNNGDGKKIKWVNFTMSGGDPLYYGNSEFTLTDPAEEGNDLACNLSVDVSDTSSQDAYTVYFNFAEEGQLRLKVRASHQSNTETGEVRFTWNSPSIIKEGSDK